MTCKQHQWPLYEKTLQHAPFEFITYLKTHRRPAHRTVLPLDHTLDAELLGHENIGYLEASGFYIKTTSSQGLSAFSSTPNPLEAQRIQTLLTVIKSLESEGQPCLLNLTGSLTTLSYFLPLSTLFKTQRQQPDQVKKAIENLLSLQMNYCKAAYDLGLRAFYCSDPLCDQNLLGEKAFENWLQLGVMPLVNFIKTLPRCTLHLCPKLTHDLFLEEEHVYMNKCVFAL